MARVKRGQIWLVNLDPGFEREIRKKRPALVISHDSINEQTFNVIVIPASSIVPKILGPEMVVISKEAGLDQRSILLPVFIKSIDQKRLIKKIGEISKGKMKEVEEAVKIVLDINQIK